MRLLYSISEHRARTKCQLLGCSELQQVLYAYGIQAGRIKQLRKYMLLLLRRLKYLTLWGNEEQ
jgi:hypothetical protein